MSSAGQITPGQAVPIERVDLAAFPTRAATPCWLTVPLGLAQPVRLPAVVVRGARPGPTAMLVAGVHGDEFEGIAALPDALAAVDPAELAGSVVALPVANPLAFEAQSRESPAHADGGNLARSFPGDPAGAPTQRLAAALFDLALGLLGPDDLFVDLHSAGTRYRYLRLVGFRDIPGPARAASEEAARHFGGGELWRVWDGAGMFNAETARAGIPTVAAEAPGQGGCDPDDVTWYAAGLRNLLVHRGQLPGDPPPRDPAEPGYPTEMFAGADGLFRSGLRAGDAVADGAEVGRVTDPFGTVLGRVLAPHAGRVWALRTFGTVHGGDLVGFVAGR